MGKQNSRWGNLFGIFAKLSILSNFSMLASFVLSIWNLFGSCYMPFEFHSGFFAKQRFPYRKSTIKPDKRSSISTLWTNFPKQ